MKGSTTLRVTSAGARRWTAPALAVALLALAPPEAASAQDDESTAAYCWNSIAQLVPTYIRARNWNETRRRFHSLVCDESQSSTRAGLDLSLPIPGVGTVGFGLGTSDETRRRACEQREQYLDDRALSSFVGQVANERVVDAMRVCAQLERDRSAPFTVSETLAGESTVVVTVRRVVAGDQQITGFTPFDADARCTYSQRLPFALRNGEEWHARCPRNPDRHFGAIITTSVGSALSIVAPTRTFTLRTVIPAEPDRQVGWSAEQCRRTCNAHDRSPCEMEAVIENREPNVRLDHPIESRCTPANLGRCKYYASRVAPPVVSIDGQRVTQRWRFRSRPAQVCIRAMRYLPGAAARTDPDIIRIGPNWTPIEIRGQQVLIDADGVEYSLDDPIFERDGSRIRLRSGTDTAPPAASGASSPTPAS